MNTLIGLGGIGKMRAFRGRSAVGRDVRRDGRGIVLAFAVVFLLHLAACFVFPSNGSLNFLGMGSCYGVATFAASRMSQRSIGALKARWCLMAIGLGFGLMAVTLPLYRHLVFNFPEEGAKMQDVALLLRVLPILAAVCLTRHDFGTIFTVIDFVQITLVAVLGAFVLASTASDYGVLSSSTGFLLIMTASVFAAMLASVRCFAGGDRAEQRFFWAAALFLWVLTLAHGGMRFYLGQHPEMMAGAPVHLIFDLPCFVVTVAALTGTMRRRSRAAASAGDLGLVDTVCTIFLPACSLLLAASIVPSHFRLGMSAVGVSFVLHGVRSSVVLKKSLAAQHELLAAHRSIQDQAFSDALTGISNRRSFDLTLEREWKRAQRSGRPLALLMIDVDHFKRLNDQYGHLEGDSCLRKIAGLLRSGLGREADFLARYGGEEFAVLLVDTGIEGARIVGESLCRTVELHRCEMDDGTPVSFTISIGIASEVPMVQESSLTLVAAADKALYRAKRSGRNRVEVHAWPTGAIPATEGPGFGDSDLLLDA